MRAEARRAQHLERVLDAVDGEPVAVLIGGGGDLAVADQLLHRRDVVEAGDQHVGRPPRGLERRHGAERHAVVRAEDRPGLRQLGDERRDDLVGARRLPLRRLRPDDREAGRLRRVLEARLALDPVERRRRRLRGWPRVRPPGAGRRPLRRPCFAPLRLSGPTKGIVIRRSASTTASNRLSMLTTTMPACWARWATATSALESAGASTIAFTRRAIICSTISICRATSCSSLMPVDDQLVVLRVLLLVRSRAVLHGLEELVGERLHDQRDHRPLRAVGLRAAAEARRRAQGDGEQDGGDAAHVGDAITGD